MTLLKPNKKAIGLIAQTDLLLIALEARNKSDLKAFAKHNWAALKLLVYISFGFNLMHRRITNGQKNEAAWKEFMGKHYPKELRNEATYRNIARHFKYDEDYLNFLKGLPDIVLTKEENEHKNIGDQLKALAAEMKIVIDTPETLKAIFNPKNAQPVPEIPESEDTKPAAVSGTEQAPAPSAEEAPAPAPATDPSPAEAPPKAPHLPSPFSSAEMEFNKNLNHLILRSDYAPQKRMFEYLLGIHPLAEWDAQKVAQLKAALALAKAVYEQLP